MFEPEQVGGLYFDIMSHQNKFADVTTDEGAKAFNDDFFIKALPEHEAETETPVRPLCV